MTRLNAKQKREKEAIEQRFNDSVQSIADAFNLEANDLKAAINNKRNVELINKADEALSFRFYEATNMFEIICGGKRHCYGLTASGLIDNLSGYSGSKSVSFG